MQATKAALFISASNDLNDKIYELVTSYQYNDASRRIVKGTDDLVDRLAVKRNAFFINGLGADQRKKEDFSSVLLNFAPTCLCWGQDVFKFSNLVLCDECALYARAQDLRDLSKLA